MSPTPFPLLIATTNPGKIREIRLILAGVPQPLLTLADLPDILEPPETGTTFAANALQKAAYYGRASGLVTVAEDSGLVIDALGGRPGVESARYPGETYAEKFANLYAELAPHPRPWTARFVCSLVVVQSEGQAPGIGRLAMGAQHRASGTRHQASGTGDGVPGLEPGVDNRAGDLVQPAAPLMPSAQPLAPGAQSPVPGAQSLVPDSVLFTAEATVEGEIAPTPRGTNGFGYDPIFYYPPYGGTLAEQDYARKLAVAHRGKAFRALRAWLAGAGRPGR